MPQIEMVDLRRTKPGKDGLYDVWVLFWESDGYRWVLHKSMLHSATESERPELLRHELTEAGVFLNSDADAKAKRNCEKALKRISSSR
jgi:hypothetical protein